MILLLDEMYPAALAVALSSRGTTAMTARQLGLDGRSDPEIFAAAQTRGCAIVTENVADFTRIAADHLTSGGHHHGVLIALASRFSRRPAGRAPLVAAIRAVADDGVRDRVVYLAATAENRDDR